MSKRNSASFISQYIYNRGCMEKLKQVEGAKEIMDRACKYFLRYDSRTGLPGTSHSLGWTVEGTPFETMYKGFPDDVVWEIPTLPGADGPIGSDMPPPPEPDPTPA